MLKWNLISEMERREYTLSAPIPINYFVSFRYETLGEILKVKTYEVHQL